MPSCVYAFYQRCVGQRHMMEYLFVEISNCLLCCTSNAGATILPVICQNSMSFVWTYSFPLPSLCTLIFISSQPQWKWFSILPNCYDLKLLNTSTFSVFSAFILFDTLFLFYIYIISRNNQYNRINWGTVYMRVETCAARNPRSFSLASVAVTSSERQ